MNTMLRHRDALPPPAPGSSPTDAPPARATARAEPGEAAGAPDRGQPARPASRRPGPLDALLAALVGLPLAVLSVNAWFAWREAWRAAWAELERTADAAAEHGLRVLSGHAVAAGRVDALLRGLSDAEIRARERELHIELNRLAAELPQAEASFVIDRDGAVLVGSSVYPVPRGGPPVAADRECFLALRAEGAPAVHVSRVYTGRLGGALLFAVSRRRTGTGNAGVPPGGFDGLVNLSVEPNHIAEGLRRLAAREGDQLALIRADGEILARSNGLPEPARIPEGTRFAAAAAAGVERALHEAVPGTGGERRLYALRRVEGWPVYAAAARPRSAVVAAWRDAVAAQLAVGLPATLALFGLALLVRRGQRDLARANEGLESRVAARTADLEARAEELAALTAALADSEARFRATFEQAAVGIAQVGLDGAFLRVNGRLCAMLGYAEAELLTMTFQELTHPDDLEANLGRLRRLLAGEIATYGMEKRYLRKDGATLWGELTVSLVRDEAGAPLHFISVVQDISARKAAEAAVAASEARLRRAAEAARFATFEVHGPEGEFAASELFREMLGMPPGARCDYATVLARIHPEDRAAVEANRRRLAEHGGRFEQEFRVVLPDGSVRWLLARGEAEPGPGGLPRRMAGVNVDVTERKRAEERQALLAREVDHRAKNALAVVQAALRLTPKDDPAAYARAVEGRVATLARAHTLLAEGRWEGAGLHTMVEAELAAFRPADGAAAGTEAWPRIAVDGPALMLAPGAAQALSMALHELATNAPMYGALSAAAGRVAVSWRVDREAGLLRLRWAERGGPPVEAPPARRGFGSRVVEATVRDQLGGRVERRWEPEGLVCEVEAPLARVVAGGTATGR